MDWKSIVNRLQEMKADPISQLAYLDDVRNRCREGLIQEKVSVKDGVLQVIEKFPGIEVAATRLMVEISEFCIKQAEGQQDTSELNVNITLAIPKELEDEIKSN